MNCFLLLIDLIHGQIATRKFFVIRTFMVSYIDICGDFTVLLCWVTQDFELIAAFDPLADKVSSINHM